MMGRRPDGRPGVVVPDGVLDPSHLSQSLHILPGTREPRCSASLAKQDLFFPAETRELDLHFYGGSVVGCGNLGSVVGCGNPGNHESVRWICVSTQGAVVAVKTLDSAMFCEVLAIVMRECWRTVCPSNFCSCMGGLEALAKTF